MMKIDARRRYGIDPLNRLHQYSRPLRAAGLPAVRIETWRMKGATAAMAVRTDGNDACAIAGHARRLVTAVQVKKDRKSDRRQIQWRARCSSSSAVSSSGT